MVETFDIMRIQFWFIVTVKVSFILLSITGIIRGRGTLIWDIIWYVNGSWMTSWSTW